MKNVQNVSSLRIAALVSITAALSACPTETDEPIVEPTTMRQLAEAYVSAIGSCQVIEGDFFKVLEPNFTNDTSITADEILEQLTLAEGHPAYGPLDQDVLEDCYQAISSVGNSSCNALGEAATVSCQNLFPGLVAEGEVCDSSDQCTAGLGCQFDTACGVCVPVLAIGDACGEEVVGVCNGSESHFCNDNNECEAYETTPEPDLNVGDSCVDGSCGTFYVTGLACVEDVCVAMEVVEDGAECDTLAPTGTAPRVCKESLLSRVLYCAPSEADFEVGTCTATLAAGEECIYSPACQKDLICEDDSTCSVPGPECTMDADCGSDALCVQGVCDYQEVDGMCFE